MLRAIPATTITKWKPMSASGPPKPEKVAAMPPQYKCVDCGGHRVFGVGNPEKAVRGFTGQTFYFCKVCGKHLTAEERAADNKKIALAKYCQAGCECADDYREPAFSHIRKCEPA